MNELNIIHTANKNVWEVDLCETITYTIVIYNVIDEIIENLDIEINIDGETYYIQDTFTLNGMPSDHSPNNNISIEQIKPKENLIISFDIKLDPVDYPKEINSFTSINYTKRGYDKSLCYNDSTWCSPQVYVEKNNENQTTLNAISKTVTTPIIHKNIFIQHEISTQSIKLGEILDCKFIIRNNGSLNIAEAVLQNISNADIEIVKGSLFINTFNIKDISYNNKIYIGVIHPNETILILFKAKIKKLNTLNSLSNKGILKFFYKNDTKLYPYPRFVESNNEVVDICPDISKSVAISKIIQVPYCNPKISQVVDIFNYTVEITSKNVISSIRGYSLEQNQSNGKTIFLSGYINGRITYNADGVMDDNFETKMYTIEYELPFKTEILMPEHFNDFIESSAKIDFIDATLLDNERVYINAVLSIDLIN